MQKELVAYLRETKMNKIDKKWQAIDDAQTLAKATEILLDKQRLLAAKKEAIKIAKAKEKEVKALKKVSKKKVK